jgi:hypothetical protein
MQNGDNVLTDKNENTFLRPTKLHVNDSSVVQMATIVISASCIHVSSFFAVKVWAHFMIGLFLLLGLRDSKRLDYDPATRLLPGICIINRAFTGS